MINLRCVNPSEVNETFLQGMINRMMISFYKYGPVKDAYPHKVNALKSLLLRLEEYKKTGNTEFLMDAANFAMIEFMYPSHPDAYFRATDSDESPGRIERGNSEPVHYPNRDLLPTEEE